jgi:recombination protein RecT
MSDDQAMKQLPAPMNVATFRTMLTTAEYQAAIAEVLPAHVSVHRVFRSAIAAVRDNPKLLECTGNSLLKAVSQSAALGLDCSGLLGSAYIVPFKRTAQLIIGYQGLIDLAHRSGEVETISAEVVYEADDFKYRLGSERVIVHYPKDDADRSDEKLTHAYAIARLNGGAEQFEVLTRRQILQVRDSSAAAQSKKDTPWFTHFAAMAKKTAVRRLVKLLPLSPENARLMAEQLREEERIEYVDLRQGSGYRYEEKLAAKQQAPEAPNCATCGNRIEGKAHDSPEGEAVCEECYEAAHKE